MLPQEMCGAPNTCKPGWQRTQDEACSLGVPGPRGWGDDGDL